MTTVSGTLNSSADVSSDPYAYEIGYGRPPEEFKWKKGQKSPNPAGRTPGSFNRSTIRGILEEILFGETVTIKSKDGSSRKVVKYKALVSEIARYALERGSVRHLRMLLDLVDRYIGSERDPDSAMADIFSEIQKY